MQFIPFIKEEESEELDNEIKLGIKNSKIGDVLEFTHDGYYFYAMYTHDSELMGHLLQILKVRFTSPVKNLPLLVKEFEQGSCFPCFSAVFVLLKNNAVEKIGTLDVPKNMQKYPMFRAGIQDKSIGLWQEFKVWDGSKGRGESIDPKEFPEIDVANLPPCEIIPFERIIEISKDFPVKILS